MTILNAAKKGLKYSDNTPERTIECPECNADLAFNTNEAVWTFDGLFESCDVECEDCNQRLP